MAFALECAVKYCPNIASLFGMAYFCTIQRSTTTHSVLTLRQFKYFPPLNTRLFNLPEN